MMFPQISDRDAKWLGRVFWSIQFVGMATIVGVIITAIVYAIRTVIHCSLVCS